MKLSTCEKLSFPFSSTPRERWPYLETGASRQLGKPLRMQRGSVVVQHGPDKDKTNDSYNFIIL